MTRPTNLYQMFDTEAQSVAGPIIIEKRDAPAIRAFHAVLANKTTLPGQYPQHFELRYLGTQDEETSRLDAAVVPQTIATGTAWQTQLGITPDEVRQWPPKETGNA